MSVVQEIDPVEYRSVIRFYLLLNKSTEKIIQDLETAYKDKCPSRSTIYFWIGEFRRGRQNVHQDYSGVGRP